MRANHITGGEMYYTLTGNSGGQYQYSVVLKLYMRCNSGRQFNDPTIVAVFDRLTFAHIEDVNVSLSQRQVISLPNTNPCISDPPDVCYEVGFYYFNITLPQSENGYILSSQVNFRIAGISNLIPNYGTIGATYTAEIPGSGNANNNSAEFVGNDLVMICANNSFQYSFAAKDNDGDKLQYSFCGAYVSGTSGNATPPPPPPYGYVPYGSGYTISTPLGNKVQINPNTGLITGIAPPEGIYVVTVCVQEIRGGKVIATQRKDLQIFIAPCSIASAALNPEYMLCKDTRTINLTNGSNSPLIHTYNWNLTDNNGNSLYTSRDPSISYTFPDTGMYRVNLVVNEGQQCNDSVSSFVLVYPGFKPDFTISGICFTKPTTFKDASSSAYGTVLSWSWDFGEPGAVDDVSDQNHAIYTYPSQGDKQVQLVATDSKGCMDTVFKTISIFDKPPINLAFKDTIICVKDQLQLHVSGSGIFSWTGINLNGANDPDPIVSPLVSTTYIVHENDQGCTNSDTVHVKVVDHVNLTMMNDTTICAGDPVQLLIASDALQYSWTPSAQVSDPLLAEPIATTNATTTYKVIAHIGGCFAEKSVTLNTVPYPLANAGIDTSICFHTSCQLHGSGNGISYLWSPASTLDHPSTLNPIARPQSTTAYVLSVFDNKGCPKPGRDTVLVVVKPPIRASAGQDTTAVVSQPLQLHASGGTSYQWSPALFLSASNIADPVAVFNSEIDQIRYNVRVFDDLNCSDTASILVKIFKTGPTVFVPNAFTPNGDGLNDLLRPILAGIKRLEYFTVYNRWGQEVFTTTIDGKGWDGSYQGKPQVSESYIWVVKAIDYKGAPYFKKGAVTLIR